MSPRIGITTYARAGDERPSFSIPVSYVEAVAAAGGVPVLLPPLAAIEVVLDGIDGLVFPGGGDIGPAHYGGDEHDENYDVCAERDGFEIDLVRAALARTSLPVLCICRGMQVLNVALGGDLIAHLPEVVGHEIAHRAPGLRPAPHDVTVTRGSRVHAAHDAREMPIQSIHHQGVGAVGRDLEVSARSADGVIEALESTVHPFALGLQWHPELSAEGSAARRIFDALVVRARG